jgi:hypothetical protein
MVGRSIMVGLSMAVGLSSFVETETLSVVSVRVGGQYRQTVSPGSKTCPLGQRLTSAFAPHCAQNFAASGNCVLQFLHCI